MGTVNRSIVHPREVFKEAYRLSASSIVCIHNHPSNSVVPSKEDVLLTDHLVKTGYIQGIPIRDHIIVGEDSYYSFFEHHNILNLPLCVHLLDCFYSALGNDYCVILQYVVNTNRIVVHTSCCRNVSNRKNCV